MESGVYSPKYPEAGTLCAKHNKTRDIIGTCWECVREERMALAVASRCEEHTKYAGTGMRLGCKACDRAALAAVGLTPDYEPIIVTPVPNKRRVGQAVAFIGKQLCFFENDSFPVEIGKPVEVMITRAIFHRDENGHYKRGNGSVMALLLRVVTPDYVLVPHDGFECSGSMCGTTASCYMTYDEIRDADIRRISLSQYDLKYPRARVLIANLTPGRTGIWEAENVNSSFYNLPDIPLRAGKVWVERKRLEARGMVRIEGIARIEDASYADGVRK